MCSKKNHTTFSTVDQEDYMSDAQLERFKVQLLQWKQDLCAQEKDMLHQLRDRGYEGGDGVEENIFVEASGVSMKIDAIDAALQRIEDGTYGYCEITGEPIGEKRLNAMPEVKTCVDAQEAIEKRKKIYNSDDSRV